MVTIKDFSGRMYKLLEVTGKTTALECLLTKDRIQIRSHGWEEIGFTHV